MAFRPQSLHTTTLSHQGHNPSIFRGLWDWFVPAVIGYAILSFGAGLIVSIPVIMLMLLFGVSIESTSGTFISAAGVVMLSVVALFAYWQTTRRRAIYTRAERIQSDFIYQLTRYLPTGSVRSVRPLRDVSQHRPRVWETHYAFRLWRYAKRLPRSIAQTFTAGWSVEIVQDKDVYTVDWSIVEGSAQCRLVLDGQVLGRWVEREPRVLEAVYTGNRHTMGQSQNEFDRWNGELLSLLSRRGVRIASKTQSVPSSFAGGHYTRDLHVQQRAFTVRWSAQEERDNAVSKEQTRILLRRVLGSLWCVLPVLTSVIMFFVDWRAGALYFAGTLYCHSWVEAYRFEQGDHMGTSLRKIRAGEHRAVYGSWVDGVLSIGDASVDLSAPHHVSWSRFERQGEAYLAVAITQGSGADVKRLECCVSVQRSSWWERLPELESSAQEVSPHDFDEVIAPALVWYGRVHGASWAYEGALQHRDVFQGA